MRYPDIPMEWKDAVFRNRSLITAFGFAAYLESQGDPRYEPLQFLFSHGKVGFQEKDQHCDGVGGFAALGDTQLGYVSVMSEFRLYYPNCSVDCEWLALARHRQASVVNTPLLQNWLNLAETYLEASALTKQRWRFMTVNYGTLTCPTQQEREDANTEFAELPHLLSVPDHELRKACFNELAGSPRKKMSSSLRTRKDTITLCKLWSTFAMMISPTVLPNQIERVLPFDLHF